MENTQTTGRSRLSIFLSSASDYYELTKPGITFSVLASMLVGFLLGSAGSVDYMHMLHAIIGTWMIAAGTAAHNMFLERGLDGLMHRTNKRPFPDSRIEPKHGVTFSLTLMFFGLIYLLSVVNVVAGIVSLATTVIYLFAYTPLKRISALNVFVGAVPGALPVVGGWAAATGTVFEHGMWILFGIVFCWQIPHVIAIAWVTRKDYEHAGFQMLPKNDPNGLKAATWVLLPAILLLPSIIKLYTMEYLGLIFLIGSLLVTAWFIWYSIRFAISRNTKTAKPVMFSSFVYLPLVWIMIFIDWIVL